MTLQAALGIVTLLYQAPLALALAHQVMAMVVFTIAIVHAERLSHRAIVSRAAGGGAGGMIDVKSDAGIAVLTLTHGKANALDIEFCEALAARFMELRAPTPRPWC